MRGAVALRPHRHSERMVSGADVERRPFCYRPTPRIRRWSIRWEYGRGEQAPVPRDGRRRPSTPAQPRPTCSGKTLSCGDLRRGLNRRPHEVAGADDRLCDAKNLFRKPPGRPRTSTGKSTGSPGEGREHEGGPRIPATRPPPAASMGAGSWRRFVPPERAPGCDSTGRHLDSDPCLGESASVPFSIPRLPGAMLRTAHFSRVRGRLR